MQRLTNVLLIAAALVAGNAARAMAQPDGDGDGDGSGSGSGSGDATGGGGGSAAAEPAAPAAAGAWSTAISDRPLVIDKGKLEVHATVPIYKLSVTDPVTMTTVSSTAVGGIIGATYGVADKIEVGLHYGFGIKDFDATGTLTLHGAYAALHNDKMDLAVAGTVGLDFHSGGTDLLSLGAWFRYHINKQLSVFTGDPALPITGSGLFNPYNQLTIGLNNGNNVGLQLPVGAGYQVNPNLFAYLSTNIANIGISPSSHALIFADFIPVTVGAFYSANDKLDVGLTFSDNLKSAGDFYNITLAARYFVK